MTQPDLFEATSRGHKAAESSARRADKFIRQWTETAVAYLRTFAYKRKGKPFLAEEVRAAAEEWGLPQPPDARAWGFVMQRGRREGIVAAAGFAKAATSNGSAKVLWRAL